MHNIQGKEKHRILFMGIVFAVCMLISYIYLKYISFSGSTTPIMDYWHWIAVYGEKIIAGSISAKDFFMSDLGEHIQPMVMAVQFFVLKAADFDVRPLVVYGAIGRIILAYFLIAYFIKINIEGKRLLVLVTSVVLFACVLNLNQWELTTEPFSLGNVLRVGIYGLSFALAAQYIDGYKKRTLKKNTVYGMQLGLLCSIITVFVGGAYFVGHLMAIGVVLAWTFLQHWNEKKEYFIPMLLWGIISFVGALIYLYLYTLRGPTGHATGQTFDVLEFLISTCKAVVLFWGAALLPTALAETTGLTPFYLVGIFMMIWILCLLLYASRIKNEKLNSFPVICIWYALSISVFIAFGRSEKFSVATMTSSRYVVESSIGLVGIVWLSFSLIQDGTRKLSHKVCFAVPVIVMAILLGNSNYKEWKTGPYRQAYTENIAEMMRNIESYADDELAITQGKAQDVRFCVEFFKKNNFSIFKQETGTEINLECIVD